MARTHTTALATEVKTAWHSNIIFRKLYIVVSLMKNHYSNNPEYLLINTPQLKSTTSEALNLVYINMCF